MRTFFIFILILCGISLSGQTAKNHLKAAEQFILNGYYEDAIEQYTQAIQIEPENGKTYEERAQAYQKIIDIEKAANDYRIAAVLGVNSAENFLAAAQLFFTLDDMQQASETISKAIEQKTKFHEAYILQCQIYLGLEKYPEARTAAIHAIDAKSTAYAQYLKGICESKLGNVQQAEQDLEKAIIKDKMLYNAYVELAKIQLINNKSRYALENCNFVLSNDRENIDALVTRSKVFFAQKEFDKAINDISKAITLDSTNSELYLNRGIYYYNFSQVQNAIFDFSEALSLDMLNSDALKWRADAYERIGANSKAASDLSLLQTIMGDTDSEEVADIQKRIYTLNRESEKPSIQLTSPKLNDNLEALISEDAETVEIDVKVEDASNLKLFRVNNDTLLDNPLGSGKKDFNITNDSK